MIFSWKNQVDYNNWKEDKEKTDYANELLTKKEIDLSHGVKKIEMKNFLQTNEKDSPSIFSRKCQRELWTKVLDYLENHKHDNRAVITGNPGIGKSRSMAYLLRLLLEKRKLVVYEAKKDEKAFIFIPQDDKSYKVWICINFKPEGCAQLENPDNYCLIDPKRPSDPTQVIAHIVLAASPDVEHFKEFQKDKCTKWYMPIWKYEELKALQKEIQVEGIYLSDHEFENRYQSFGGRIRYFYK